MEEEEEGEEGVDNSNWIERGLPGSTFKISEPGLGSGFFLLSCFFFASSSFSFSAFFFSASSRLVSFSFSLSSWAE